MSYSIYEASAEQQQAIVAAINSRDSEALYQLAQIVKEQGDDEQAEALLTEARKMDTEEGTEDYKEERDTAEYEAYREAQANEQY